jgi:hypothetical protein
LTVGGAAPMWDALRLALSTIKDWPYRWAGVVAVSAVGAALAGMSLHLLFGLTTITSVVISAVLGLLVLAAALLMVAMGLALARFVRSQVGVVPDSTPGYVMPGNLPSALGISDSPDAQSSGSGEGQEVWE